MRPAPEFYKDRQGHYRWRMRAKNGRIIAEGGEGYSRLRDAKRGALGAVHRLSLWGVRGNL